MSRTLAFLKLLFCVGIACFIGFPVMTHKESDYIQMKTHSEFSGTEWFWFFFMWFGLVALGWIGFKYLEGDFDKERRYY